MATKSSKFIKSNEISWENPAQGLSRQILGYDGQLMMVRIKFEKGSIGYAHQHFHSQCSYVVSGKFEVVIGNEKKILTTGDGFYAEPDIEHGVVCIEDGELIDVFSPSRQDFLK